jgi:hypothetical protein
MKRSLIEYNHYFKISSELAPVGKKSIKDRNLT